MVKRRRTLKWAIWSAALVIVAMVVLWMIPSQYVVMAPGITGDLTQMVSVEHAKMVPGPGKLLMVAVTVQPASELLYLGAHLDSAVEIVPKNQVMGPLTMNQYEQFNVSLMDSSQVEAEMAGESLAGLPAKTLPGAVVVGVLKHSGASGKLNAGDVITQVGQYPVTSANALATNVMSHFKPGEIVPVTIQRKGQTQVIPIHTGHAPGDPNPAIGVYIAPRYSIPRKVNFKANNIGGPSAGMMFAMEIYEQLVGANLTHGQIVAGTGTISANGQVGAIGGIAQKVITVENAGAQIFFCPQANYAKAKATATARGYTHLRIVPVKTLQQAVSTLQHLS